MRHYLPPGVDVTPRPHIYWALMLSSLIITGQRCYISEQIPPKPHPDSLHSALHLVINQHGEMCFNNQFFEASLLSFVLMS